MAGIGEEFYKRTGYSRKRPFGGVRPKAAAPFKSYPGAKTVKLVEPELPEGSLWKALKNRRSRREFKREAISKDQLSLLVWACQGVTAKVSDFLLRTAPSAGALFPVETYLVINRVTGIESGIYHWNIVSQDLELLNSGDFSREIQSAGLGQEMCGAGSAVFAWTAVFARSASKYSDRGYRYVLMDAAHVCQNLYLACEDLGLGCCGIGAYLDDEAGELLGLDPETEGVVYLAAVGKY